MSDNLNLGRVPEGTQTPEVLINGAFSKIDALFTEALSVDLSAGNAEFTAAGLVGASFLSLEGAAVPRTLALPAAKRILFALNVGTADVTVTRGTGSVVIPAGKGATLRLTGAENGLAVIGGTGEGGGGGLPPGGSDGQYLAKDGAEEGAAEWRDLPAGGGGGLSEAPSDGKTYGRKNAAWAEIPASAGGSPGTAPTFSIWRLYGTIRSGKNQIGISTFNINNAVIGTTPVAASSTENSTSYPANNARPGTSGSWYSAPDTDTNPWIEYTFPAPIAGDSIYLYHDTSNQQYMPGSIRLEARNSTSDPWTVVIPDTPHNLGATVGEISYGIPRVGGGSGGGGLGPYPIEPPTAASHPLEFKSGSGVVGVLVDNPRALLIRRTDRGASNVDSNFERMRNIDSTKNYTLDAIIKAPTLNRGSYTRYGLALRESATDKHVYYYLASESSSPQIARLNASNIQGAGAGFSNLKSYSFSDCYFRIEKSSTQYKLLFSDNYGITFETLATYPLNQYFTAQADQVGLIAQCYGSFSSDMDLVCPYFKLTYAN